LEGITGEDGAGVFGTCVETEDVRTGNVLEIGKVRLANGRELTAGEFCERFPKGTLVCVREFRK
jgi:hypothetical protein